MKTMATAALAFAALAGADPAFALAEGSFYVRNDTGQAQNCTVRHAGTNYAAPIVLRAGGEWSATSRTDRREVLGTSGRKEAAIGECRLRHVLAKFGEQDATTHRGLHFLGRRAQARAAGFRHHEQSGEKDYR